MEQRKNLCAQVPLSLHNRVTEAREALGQTTSEYITNLLTEYFKMKENGGKGIMATNSRTMAFQIDEKLFQRIKAHLERESARLGRKVTQREFVLGLIEGALNMAEPMDVDEAGAALCETPDIQDGPQAPGGGVKPNVGQRVGRVTAQGDVSGSDKSVAFPLPCAPALDWVAVFEAPIDLMSFCTLHPRIRSNAVALCGLFSGALDTYLKDHPHLKRIILCLDADGPGQEATEKLTAAYEQRGYHVSTRTPPLGKDWNEYLQHLVFGKEIKPSKIKKTNTKKEELQPMADLEKLVNDKAAADTRWRELRQAERETATGLRDASINEITTNPEAYARYLDLQGDNPAYGAGNIALMMIQQPEATLFGTRDRWRGLGRFVLEDEQDRGAKIFIRSPSGRGYVLSDAYDVSQTQGREVKPPLLLQDDTREMETALTVLLRFSPVPVVADKELTDAALYDPKSKQLIINPSYSDSEAFAAIAAQIAHARFHDKGFNQNYRQESYDLSAQSVSCVLCRRFGIEREVPAPGKDSCYYPISVEEYTYGPLDELRIDKVYQLSLDGDPGGIPTEDFVRGGRLYYLLDMTKKDEVGVDTKPYIHTITQASDTNNMEAVLQQLDAELEVTTEDGYTGTLHMDHTTVQVTTDGYATRTGSVSASRTYPNLSEADLSLIPKTVEDRGRSLTLADVQWSDSTQTDGEGNPMIRYTATAKYTGTTSSKYAIGLSVKVYQGTDSKTLAKGAGHFTDTSIWDGNCCLAGHNRGVNNHFGKIHTLEPGDTITLTTKLGTRTYAVTSVEKVSETDTSGTAATSDNRITLFTCVRDERDFRWKVTALEQQSCSAIVFDFVPLLWYGCVAKAPQPYQKEDKTL